MDSLKKVPIVGLFVTDEGSPIPNLRVTITASRDHLTVPKMWIDLGPVVASAPDGNLKRVGKRDLSLIVPPEGQIYHYMVHMSAKNRPDKTTVFEVTADTVEVDLPQALEQYIEPLDLPDWFNVKAEVTENASKVAEDRLAVETAVGEIDDTIQNAVDVKVPTAVDQKITDIDLPTLVAGEINSLAGPAVQIEVDTRVDPLVTAAVGSATAAAGSAAEAEGFATAAELSGAKRYASVAELDDVRGTEFGFVYSDDVLADLPTQISYHPSPLSLTGSGWFPVTSTAQTIDVSGESLVLVTQEVRIAFGTPYYAGGLAGRTIVEGKPLGGTGWYWTPIHIPPTWVSPESDKVLVNKKNSLGITWVEAPADSGGGLSGQGRPHGVVDATPGTVYTDTLGTAGAWQWIKVEDDDWACLYGDTGWRDISDELSFFAVTNVGPEGATVLYRRTQNQLLLFFTVDSLGESYRSLKVWLTFNNVFAALGIRLGINAANAIDVNYDGLNVAVLSGQLTALEDHPPGIVMGDIAIAASPRMYPAVVAGIPNTELGV